MFESRRQAPLRWIGSSLYNHSDLQLSVSMFDCSSLMERCLNSYNRRLWLHLMYYQYFSYGKNSAPKLLWNIEPKLLRNDAPKTPQNQPVEAPVKLPSKDSSWNNEPKTPVKRPAEPPMNLRSTDSCGTTIRNSCGITTRRICELPTTQFNETQLERHSQLTIVSDDLKLLTKL